MHYQPLVKLNKSLQSSGVGRWGGRIIVTALTAGAVAAAKDTAEKGVKDTYKGLKTFNYQQRRQWLSVKLVSSKAFKIAWHKTWFRGYKGEMLPSVIS